MVFARLQVAALRDPPKMIFGPIMQKRESKISRAFPLLNGPQRKKYSNDVRSVSS